MQAGKTLTTHQNSSNSSDWPFSGIGLQRDRYASRLQPNSCVRGVAVRGVAVRGVAVRGLRELSLPCSERNCIEQ
jgi:hypothetical protein